MDDFDVEARIRELELAYERAANALRDARMRLEVLRADPRTRASELALAETRLQAVVARRDGLRLRLERLEERGEAGAPRITHTRAEIHGR